MVYAFEAAAPTDSATGLREFMALRTARGMVFATHLTVRAVCETGCEYSFSLGRELVAMGPGGLRFSYLFQQTDHDSVEDALTSVPRLSPCRAEDEQRSFPSRRAAKSRAGEIASQWPEARLGIVVVRESASPFVAHQCFFRGADLQLLQASRVAAVAG